jgi:hypothetical protein
MNRGRGSRLASHSADTAAWIVRISGWFVIRGLIVTGWSQLAPPAALDDWPPRPRRVLWRHAARTGLAGIERHLASSAGREAASGAELADGTAQTAKTEEERT